MEYGPEAALILHCGTDDSGERYSRDEKKRPPSLSLWVGMTVV